MGKKLFGSGGCMGGSGEGGGCRVGRVVYWDRHGKLRQGDQSKTLITSRNGA